MNREIKVKWREREFTEKSGVNREMTKKSVVNRELEVPWAGLMYEITLYCCNVLHMDNADCFLCLMMISLIENS